MSTPAARVSTGRGRPSDSRRGPELDRVAGRRLPARIEGARNKKGREHEREQDAPVGGRVVEETSVRALFFEHFIVIILAGATRRAIGAGPTSGRGRSTARA